MDEARRLLNLLHKGGLRFVAETDGPNGGATFAVDVDQALTFLGDWEAATAGLWGVTKEQYRDWQDAEHRQRCSALTKKGKPCRNCVPVDKPLTPTEWVRAQGSYCRLHEGEHG